MASFFNRGFDGRMSVHHRADSVQLCENSSSLAESSMAVDCDADIVLWARTGLPGDSPPSVDHSPWGRFDVTGSSVTFRPSDSRILAGHGANGRGSPPQRSPQSADRHTMVDRPFGLLVLGGRSAYPRQQ
jgi:hypothetical protein